LPRDRLPNVLFVMTDQQRFDTIAALGNSHIYTPNMDRLVRRGVTFTNAYSTCPVCVAARYTVRTGAEPPTTRVFTNRCFGAADGQPEAMEERCGPYLARVMRSRGYRTFGVGKFHAQPRYEDLGYDIHLHSEELYGTPENRERDGFASWIAREHPEYDFIEGLMGERTEMYYMPQMSPLPAECTVESWAADRAVEGIAGGGAKPFFGFVSFIGPHPPFAPPIPFNRMYDPDRMPPPVRGDIATDHMDEMIPYMNRIIWADHINDFHAQVLKARYYGEISYIDDCLRRMLDAVDALPDAANTLVCMFADHGDHLGDHQAWQKESFFEESCRVPFLVSWPDRLEADTVTEELVCLADLFGIATAAAGAADLREGADVLGMLGRTSPRRERVVGWYAEPGSPHFKTMVREGRWKYISMANGGREQLFDLEADPREHVNLAGERSEVTDGLRAEAARACDRPGSRGAIEGGKLREFPYRERERGRIYQFVRSRGVRGFPEHPGDAIREFRERGGRAGPGAT
jgi:choline-sulfatase